MKSEEEDETNNIFVIISIHIAIGGRKTCTFLFFGFGGIDSD